MPALSPSITAARNVYAFVIFAFLFVFPIIVSLILNSVITNARLRQESGPRRTVNAKDAQFFHKLHKYNKMDSAIYSICFLPFYLLDVVKELVPFWVVEHILHICLYVSRILVVSYFCVSPLVYFGFFKIHKVLSGNKSDAHRLEAYENSKAYQTRQLYQKRHSSTPSHSQFNKCFEKPRIISFDKVLTDEGLIPAIQSRSSGNQEINLQPIINVNVTANIHNYSCDSSPTSQRNINDTNCSINVVI
ncbi:Oidioi.mRNA.OKI2018_I69.chr1.g152.t1.cds [Oikopleura dioica]|uniref:Oidioi.mRNA.OKI2018_I69.chr1.g152.t1.cds n=1 Tax=Oikopleura dioica TaxID=34765 RepID=A0ABN7SKP9_OIKDI|nr:Oidioi.mRNA.OKI2018_I69.chr1.g152.t1.cds [Oikopleura dioica]